MKLTICRYIVDYEQYDDFILNTNVYNIIYVIHFSNNFCNAFLQHDIGLEAKFFGNECNKLSACLKCVS